MSRLFYHVMQDNSGNLLFDVSGTMRLAGSGTLATIYGDEALTIIISNPMTNHPSFGSFKCFLGAGDYDFYMAKSGYSFETLTGVQGHGTMAQQDAASVAITGGSATFTGQVGIGTTPAVGFALTATETRLQALTVQGDIQVVGQMAIATAPALGQHLTVPNAQIQTLAVPNQAALGGGVSAGNRLTVRFNHANMNGIAFKPLDSDTGVWAPCVFLSLAEALIGSITTTAAATAYNTTSDARLKHDVQDLTGELAVIRALRPVSFRWLADETPGVGFIASEVAQHVQGVITGEQDALNEDGSILPQMIDMSKLVPFLVGAVKSLIERLEALQARVEVLEDAAGV